MMCKILKSGSYRHRPDGRTHHGCEKTFFLILCMLAVRRLMEYRETRSRNQFFFKIPCSESAPSENCSQRHFVDLCVRCSLSISNGPTEIDNDKDLLFFLPFRGTGDGTGSKEANLSGGRKGNRTLATFLRRISDLSIYRGREKLLGPSPVSLVYRNARIGSDFPNAARNQLSAPSHREL